MANIETMRVAAPDGIETILRCKGPGGGAGVILVHGILHCSLIWKNQFADAAFSGIRVAAYDIRGHGAAGKPAGSEFYEPERFAGELDAVIRASGIDRPVIVGWSLGTRMTFNYLATHGADALGGFVIVGARASQIPSSRDAGQNAIALSCADDLETRLRARLAFVRACYGVPLSAGDMAEIAACAMLVPPDVLRHFAGRPMDYESLLAGLPIPVRVLHGARDPVCPLDEVMRIGQINRTADISVYRELGHAPFFEDPERFDADLVSFVNRCRPRGQGGSHVPVTGAIVE